MDIDLLRRLVEYVTGEQVPLPSGLVDRLLSIRTPWMVVGQGKDPAAAMSERSARFQGYWREYLGGVLDVLGSSEATIDSRRLELNFGVLGIPKSGPPGRSSRISTVRGPVEDLLYFQVFNLLHTVGFDRLRRCECGKPFVRTGRREFCSVRCQKRVYMKNQRRLNPSRRAKRHGKATRTR